MALAGYCAGCGENVWLTPSGACPRGHDPAQVSNVYETGATALVQPPQAPAPGGLPAAPPPLAGGTPEPGTKGRTGIIVAAVILGALLSCCLIGSILAAIAIPAFTSAQSTAQKRACFANERNVEGAVQIWTAENNGEMPGSVDDLVSAGYLKAVPECPSGGDYTFDPYEGRYTCSEHGHY